jgi:NADH-quinone oxidoreductase subunit M
VESLILILPLLFGLLALFVPTTIQRGFALFSSLALFVFAIIIATQYDVYSGYTFIVKEPFWGKITMTLGYDGISVWMILLTCGVIPLILLSNYKRELAQNKTFNAMVFFMQFGLIGVFTALDGILFYFFWEITLIPIFVIAYLFGEPERKAALLKFFIYTFVGSIAMLISILALGSMATSFGHKDLVNVVLGSSKTAFYIMLGFFFAFAVKIPIFPFHTWQPDTYSKAPMAGTMLLSGIMLKMALYGLIRWLLPLFPEVCAEQMNWFIILAIIGVMYAAIIAIMQNDLKRLFAYASMSHVGLMAAGILTRSHDAIAGGILQMVNHAVVAVGLFLAIDVIERRLKTRELSDLGGIAKKAPQFAFWFAVLAFASVSVPFTSGFIGEFLLIQGVYNYNWIFGLLVGTSVILGAVYTFRGYQLSMFGPEKEGVFADLHWSELAVFGIIMIVVLVFGLWPDAIIGYVSPSVKSLVELM